MEVKTKKGKGETSMGGQKVWRHQRGKTKRGKLKKISE